MIAKLISYSKPSEFKTYDDYVNPPRGCEDLIIEGINGYCYEPRNIIKAIKLIEKIKEMGNNEYRTLSKNSFLYAKLNLDRKILSKQICKAFKKYV